MRKIKICFPFVGDKVGGSHISTVTLIKSLPDNYQPLIVIFQEGQLKDYLQKQSVPYQVINGINTEYISGFFKQVWICFISSIKLVRFLKRQNVDLVHTNDLRMHFLWALPAKLIGCRFIWHQRTIDLSRRILLFSKFCDKHLTISEFCKTNFQKKLSCTTIVVHNPFDVYISRKLKNEAILKYQNIFLTEKSFIIGYFGNFQSRKRPDWFIHIAKTFYDTVNQDDVYFVLIGDDRDLTAVYLTSLIDKYELRTKVKVLGFQTNVIPWLAGCNLVVAPGINEPFGRVLVEAMLLNIPVIAADSGGHREIVEHGKTGFLVDPGSLWGYLPYIQKVLNQENEISNIVARAYEMARFRYSVENHIKNICQIYQEVMQD